MPTTKTIEVPAREGRAVRIPRDTSFRIVDIEGMQVADLFAFNGDDVGEFHSAMHTRVATNRLFPLVGEAFVTNRRRAILIFERDDTPGMHDMLIAPCDAERYKRLDVDGWHASCVENLQGTMRDLGHDSIIVPQPINLFMNVPVGEGGSLAFEPPRTREGDSVTFRAAMDAIVVVSACPQDILPVNDGNPTPLAIEFPSDDAARS
jgi:uncharacterized protein